MRTCIRCTIALAVLAFAGGSGLWAFDKISLTDLAGHAARQSRLTGPDGKPFYLKVSIVETTNPDSEFKGELEEYWISPLKWRRTITAPGFSQTMIVNGDKVSESDSGDYYPLWLRDVVAAFVDPSVFGGKSTGEMKRFQAQIEKPATASNKISCAQFQTMTGIAPVVNNVMEQFCFEGDYNLPLSITMPGYLAQFKHYKLFGKKMIARSVILEPDSGTTIEAKVMELSELSSREDGNDKLFTVQQQTSAAEELKSLPLPEDELRKLLTKDPEISWPAVESGKTTGALSVYVSVDRTGKVREVWPLRSDNTELDDSILAQLRQWEFKPAVANGIPVQVEGILTFSFQAAEKAASGDSAATTEKLPQ